MRNDRNLEMDILHFGFRKRNPRIKRKKKKEKEKRKEEIEKIIFSILQIGNQQ